jgi:hypothetical protein
MKMEDAFHGLFQGARCRVIVVGIELCFFDPGGSFAGHCSIFTYRETPRYRGRTKMMVCTVRGRSMLAGVS